ncbi:response regulator [Asticcacaulis taihuensis]|uniref:response regulator n=1 Tax=Asticcacaulis taihuensis TaxID=260084 RepID=UPI0026E9AF0E|nr:response regulator [Asticcacaulis taihuensis]
MADSPRILSIEDECDIRKFLRTTLGANGMMVLEAETGKAGLQKVVSQIPDVILLDLGLPDMDGMEIIRQIREWGRTPIIVLSARGQEADKVEALELGADDYLTKPFSAAELIARIKVVLRNRNQPQGDAPFVYDYDNLRIDTAARRIQLDGEDVHLTPIEYKLLAVLARNSGKVLTHGALLNEVWGKHSTDNQTYLRIHTQHLREKLKDDALNPRFIVTEPGIGYRLKP